MFSQFTLNVVFLDELCFSFFCLAKSESGKALTCRASLKFEFMPQMNRKVGSLQLDYKGLTA